MPLEKSSFRRTRAAAVVRGGRRPESACVVSSTPSGPGTPPREPSPGCRRPSPTSSLESAGAVPSAAPRPGWTASCRDGRRHAQPPSPRPREGFSRRSWSEHARCWAAGRSADRDRCWARWRDCGTTQMPDSGFSSPWPALTLQQCGQPGARPWIGRWIPAPVCRTVSFG